MKRSRAFILTEQLMTILLQAGFILVLCMSFYMLTVFYAQTQQIMTARNHAEIVISFVDNKIRYAGLGLWRCTSPADIGNMLDKIGMLSWTDNGERAYRLPVSLKWHRDGMSQNNAKIPQRSGAQNAGDVITLLYAQKSLATEDNEVISAFSSPVTLQAEKSKVTGNPTGNLTGTGELLDRDSIDKLKNSTLLNFTSSSAEKYIKRYAVMESFGFPIYLSGSPSASGLPVKVLRHSEETTIPAAGELMGLNCMQMFVHGTDAGEGRQFAYRELQDSGNAWDNTYNQEKGILDIYMERDNDSNTFTLWVLATGGYDESLDNPRPETWPDNAEPRLSTYNSDTRQTHEDAKTAWSESSYRHHIVYVSRASWKLNNLEGFSW